MEKEKDKEKGDVTDVTTEKKKIAEDMRVSDVSVSVLPVLLCSFLILCLNLNLMMSSTRDVVCHGHTLDDAICD